MMWYQLGFAHGKLAPLSPEKASCSRVALPGFCSDEWLLMWVNWGLHAATMILPWWLSIFWRGGRKGTEHSVENGCIQRFQWSDGALGTQTPTARCQNCCIQIRFVVTVLDLVSDSVVRGSTHGSCIGPWLSLRHSCAWSLIVELKMFSLCWDDDC